MIVWPDATMTHVGSGEYDCRHMVQDVRWGKCSTSLGWTYLKAFNEVHQRRCVGHCLVVAIEHWSAIG